MEKRFLSLHPAQRDVYTDQLINAGSAHYNIGGYIRLKGRLDKKSFEETVHSIPQVFDAFKLRFKLEAEGPVSYLDESFDKASLEELDLSEESNPKQAALTWMQEQFNTAFTLEEGSLLFQNCLIRIAEDEHWYFG